MRGASTNHAVRDLAEALEQWGISKDSLRGRQAHRKAIADQSPETPLDFNAAAIYVGLTAHRLHQLRRAGKLPGSFEEYIENSGAMAMREHIGQGLVRGNEKNAKRRKTAMRPVWKITRACLDSAIKNHHVLLKANASAAAVQREQRRRAGVKIVPPDPAAKDLRWVAKSRFSGDLHAMRAFIDALIDKEGRFVAFVSFHQQTSNAISQVLRAGGEYLRTSVQDALVQLDWADSQERQLWSRIYLGTLDAARVRVSQRQRLVT